jgi:tRNA dimethylallyltransferase
MTAEQRRLHGHDATGVFFIVGPTATGKSELAADVAQEIGAEVISADAFQIYRELDLLTAKPDAATIAKAPHHLIDRVPLHEDMNAEKFRRAASRAIGEIHSRDKLAIVVGGSGLYIKTLTHGLADLPAADPKLRAQLHEMSLNELHRRLVDLDPEAARKIDVKNQRRLVRAVEVCLLTGKPVSERRMEWNRLAAASDPAGRDQRSRLPASSFFAIAMSFTGELTTEWKQCLKMA